MVTTRSSGRAKQQAPEVAVANSGPKAPIKRRGKKPKLQPPSPKAAAAPKKAPTKKTATVKKAPALEVVAAPKLAPSRIQTRSRKAVTTVIEEPVLPARKRKVPTKRAPALLASSPAKAPATTAVAAVTATVVPVQVAEEAIQQVLGGQADSPSSWRNASPVFNEDSMWFGTEYHAPSDVDGPVLTPTQPKFASPAQPKFTSPTPPKVASPTKPTIPSPQTFEAKTPKKFVTFEHAGYYETDSEIIIPEGPLNGNLFYIDIKSKKFHDDNHLFTTLLEDLGGQVIKNWTSNNLGITHVLFKDGSAETLDKVRSTDGAVKCVNVGWAIECEKTGTHVDETPYLVDLHVATPSPVPIKKTTFTPWRTPSKFMESLRTPAQASFLDIPPTPTSSEFDHSIIHDDDKENSLSEIAPLFQTPRIGLGRRKSPLKMKAWTAGQKRSSEDAFGSTSVPPKKPRFD
ncbi:hypothetical protein BDV95DRAFT_610426 [Massariosphaeria phaeospora]|uniref:BRCT domain-containing protein n=1 Tax=Massariosphaeria phaeospora TaxID=100035 RepID=A0A7C8MIL0_9PLEO|nr:hypothetical protein BDV95DRAFT_610426 [Massariosphaeria phaeospora]